MQTTGTAGGYDSVDHGALACRPPIIIIVNNVSSRFCRLTKAGHFQSRAKRAAGLPCVISDRVPVECDITGNVTVVPLDETPEKWADVVINQMNNFEKKDTYSQIVDAGFGIKAQAVWLEEFYRKALEENGFKLSEN